MKKFARLLAVLTLVCVSSAAYAFDAKKFNSAVSGTKFLFKAGLGYVSAHAEVDGHSGTLEGISVPIGLEFLLHSAPVPLGIMVEFVPTWDDAVYGHGWIDGYSFALLGGANWHPDLGIQNLDVYAGAKLGVRYNHIKVDGRYGGDSYNGMNLTYGAQVGASYFFTDKVGVNSELGYPTYISASVAVKF